LRDIPSSDQGSFEGPALIPIVAKNIGGVKQYSNFHNNDFLFQTVYVILQKPTSICPPL